MTSATAYFTGKGSQLEYVPTTVASTVLQVINLGTYRVKDIMTRVSDDIIASIGYQSIIADKVLLKAVIAWGMADEIGKASLLVCCMNGNKHARLLKKGRVDAAKFLSPLVVDTNRRADLTLGRFMVSLGCVFRLNIKNWHLKNSGHAAFSEKVYKKQFYNFLRVQVDSWRLYNPKKELTSDIITKTASVMNQQRASCVLFLEEENPFESSMTKESFAELYKVKVEEVPEPNPASPCCTLEELEEMFRSLTEADVRGLETRTGVDPTLIIMPTSSSSLSTSSSSSAPVTVKAPVKRTVRHKGWTYTLSEPYYVDKDGMIYKDGSPVYQEDTETPVTPNYMRKASLASRVKTDP